VDEIGETGTFEGNLWSFTTQEFLVVEDFESYDDKENRIYEAWIDGEINNTGSTVGYMESIQGTFGERTIVRSGRQSMPIFYDNTGKTTAEAQRTLDAQDWTARGVKSLSLFFHGAPRTPDSCTSRSTTPRSSMTAMPPTSRDPPGRSGTSICRPSPAT
jgi:hypothetical protein